MMLNQGFLQRLFIMLLMLSFMSTTRAEEMGDGIFIESVSSIKGERVYYMNARIKIQLPEYVSHAIYNGVPLPLLLQIEVKEDNNWWFDSSLVTVEQRYVLHYLPLLDAVRLINVTGGSSTTIGSLERALGKISDIKNFPFLDREHFNLQKNTYARVRLKIDSQSLPKPLKTQALLGGNWELSSDWKQWELQ